MLERLVSEVTHLLLNSLVTLLPVGYAVVTGFRDDLHVIVAMTLKLPCPLTDMRLSIYPNIYPQICFGDFVEGRVKLLLFLHNIF